MDVFCPSPYAFTAMGAPPCTLTGYQNECFLWEMYDGTAPLSSTLRFVFIRPRYPSMRELKTTFIAGESDWVDI